MHEIRINTNEPPTTLAAFMKGIGEHCPGLEDCIINRVAMKVGDVHLLNDKSYIIEERKSMSDQASSIHDGRTWEQLDDMQRFELDDDDERNLVKVIVVHGDWHDFYGAVKVKDGKVFPLQVTKNQHIGAVKDYVLGGISFVGPFPKIDDFVKFSLDMLEGKEPKYMMGSGYIRKNKKNVDRFALSMMALVDRLGQKKGKILSGLYSNYSELKKELPLVISNKVRTSLNQKEGKKPIPTIQKLWELA